MSAGDGRATSRATDQDAGNENQDSAQSDLQSSRQSQRLHVAMPDPGDDAQFDHNNQNGGNHSHSEIGDQEWQRVANTAKRSHEPANESPHPGMTAAGEAAVVGQGLGEAHAYAGAD